MQYVLITGASRELGKALLQTFWENGDFVFPLIRSKEVGQLIKGNFSDRCAPIICDVYRVEGISTELDKFNN